MKIDRVYYVGIHRYSYRAGIPGEIVGVAMVNPRVNGGFSPKPCFYIKWSDGMEDYAPICDDKTYKIISFQDILDGKIPEITE